MLNTFLYLLSATIWVTLQQCPSSAADFTKNQLMNGQFESPVITTSPTFYPGGFYPWTTTLAQIGYGTDYNSNWGSTQVASLDSGYNQQYTQTFNIPYQDLFFFSVSFAKRQNYSPSTSGLRIYWNGRNVAQQPTASDDLIHSITLNLTTVQGTNTIIIQAMGHDDGKGTTIDDVGIYPYIYYHRVEILGVCTCAVGYFDNGYNYQCVLCSDMIDFCSACTFAPDLTQLTPDCTNNITSGVNCSFGAFSCTSCQSGYYLNINGTCQSIFSSSSMIGSFYEPGWQLEFIPCNNFKVVLQIQLALYNSLSQINTNISQITIKSSTINPTSQQDTYNIEVQASYRVDIPDETITFIVKYYDTYNTLTTAATILKTKSSSLPLVYYAQSQCASLSNVQELALAIVAITYIIMFFSSISSKIVGLELFGVLQLAYFSLASHQDVNIYLQPLLKWKYVNGYNVQTTHPTTKVSNSIYHIGYKDNFIFNINFMFAVLLLNLVAGGIMYCIGTKKYNETVKKISIYTLTIVYITIFLFNSLNLSFSIGLHYKYADALTTDGYGLGTFGTLIGIGFFIFTIVQIQCICPQYFGEFKSKFKKNSFVDRFYISLTIIYRFVLGFYIAQQNQWYLGTLIILALSISFIMYNVINLPFRKAYQNYRANICHFTHLLILLVSNYYRSMKVNVPLNQKARLNWPAILQLIAICLCILVSFACLIYEIVKQLKRWSAKRKILLKATSQQGIKTGNQFNIKNNEAQINKTQQQLNAITQQK